jgi:hypothetical protein
MIKSIEERILKDTMKIMKIDSQLMKMEEIKWYLTGQWTEFFNWIFSKKKSSKFFSYFFFFSFFFSQKEFLFYPRGNYKHENWKKRWEGKFFMKFHVEHNFLDKLRCDNKSSSLKPMLRAFLWSQNISTSQTNTIAS